MTDSRTINVGLVGCGQIADAHLQQLRRIRSARTVAVCDLEPLLARQAAERFDIPRQFQSLDDMLSDTQLDVVHVTTPVSSHAALATRLLQAGIHVYVEKPFSTDVVEARNVADTAHRCRRLVCLGHDQLFDPTWLRAQALIQQGRIGDVCHVDSVLGYPLQGPFGKQVMSDPGHWVRRLPGGLFQNTISHPLYRITEFLPDTHPQIQAQWFSMDPALPFPTELRVHLRGANVTGTLHFTCMSNLYSRVTRIYGTTGLLEVNLDSQLIRHHRPARLPGAFSRIETACREFAASGRGLRQTLSRFLWSEIHYFAGMKTLFERFHDAIRGDAEPPVPIAEALRVTALMDRIFDECRRNAAFQQRESENDAAFTETTRGRSSRQQVPHSQDCHAS